MQGSNWSGPSTQQARAQYPMNGNDQNAVRTSYLSQFNGAIMADGMNVPSGMHNGHEQMSSLYRQPTQEEIFAVLSQYTPGSTGPFRLQAFSHSSQINMQQQPSGQPASMQADGSQQNMSGGFPGQDVNLDPAAAAAAAAAYGHLGYNTSISAPGSQKQSLKDGDGSKAQMGAHNATAESQGFDPELARQIAMQDPSFAYQMIGNGYDGGDIHSGNDDFAGKKRRMTYGGQIPGIPSSSKPGLLQHENSASSIGDTNSMGATPMQDGQQGMTRPPFRHGRSRSGSELAGNLPGFRSSASFDGLSISQSFPAGNLSAQAPPVFFSSHSHSQSFNRQAALPPSALGGHAASHPPGLGSQILRGVDVSASGSSAASDFTKRKGWTGRVVEELLDFVHVLDPEGVIMFASPSVYGLTGWSPEELRGRKLTDFIHPQDVASVEREIKRMRSSNGDLLTYYRFKTKFKPKNAEKDNDSSAGDTWEKQVSSQRMEAEHAEFVTRDGDFVVFEASGQPYFPPKPTTVPSNGARELSEDDEDDLKNFVFELNKGDGQVPNSEPISASASGSKQGAHSLSQSINPRDTPSESSNQLKGPLQCFFCSARPYPSKNTSMLDSFLELKLENEKLRLLIADMDLTGPENDADNNNLAAAYNPDLIKQEIERDEFWKNGGVNPMFGSFSQDMRFSQGASLRNNSLGSHPTSPKMRNGPKDDLLAGFGSAGPEVSDTETTSPTNATAPGGGAAGGSVDEARRKKKLKQDDSDHVCTDCGRVDSPEWRKGPLGPKTLCNACGLRWAKKIKRKGGDPNLTAGVLAQQAGAAPQMMPHHLQHTFGRSTDGQMQGMAMGPPPPGSINTMQMGMMPTSPVYTNRNSFDDGKNSHGHGPGM